MPGVGSGLDLIASRLAPLGESIAALDHDNDNLTPLLSRIGGWGPSAAEAGVFEPARRGIGHLMEIASSTHELE